MHFSTIVAGLSLAASVRAWSITLYDQADCNSASSFNYYSVSGAANPYYSSLFQLSQSPPSDISCSYYANSGATAATSCTGQFGTAQSFYNHGGDYQFNVQFTSSQLGCQTISVNNLQAEN